MKTTRKARVKPTPAQAQTSADDHSHEMICHQVAKVRAVAQLLDNISENRYENQGAWEEFGEQVEALSDALMPRVMNLEEVVKDCEARRTKLAAAGGGR